MAGAPFKTMVEHNFVIYDLVVRVISRIYSGYSDRFLRVVASTHWQTYSTTPSNSHQVCTQQHLL